MKTNSKPKLTINLIAFFVLLAMLSSCSDDSEDPTPADVDSAEVAEIVAGSLAKDAQGMTAQMEASAEEAEESNGEDDDGGRTEQSACGQQFSDQFSLQSPENQAISYDYAFQYNYAFECNEFNVPSSMEFSLTQSGEVDAPRFGSNNQSSGSWMLSGLELSTTEYSFDGNYQREGNHFSKIGEQNGYDFNLSIDFSDVKMNKGNYVISQGTGSFSISGNDNLGDGFSVSGRISFLGDQQILVNINGDEFLINTRTGEVTPL